MILLFGPRGWERVALSRSSPPAAVVMLPLRWTILTSSSSSSPPSPLLLLRRENRALLLRHISHLRLLSSLTSSSFLLPFCTLMLIFRSILALSRFLAASIRLDGVTLSLSFSLPRSSCFFSLSRALDTLYTFLKAFARPQKQSVRANSDRADTRRGRANIAYTEKSRAGRGRRKVSSPFSAFEKCARHCKRFDPT